MQQAYVQIAIICLQSMVCGTIGLLGALAATAAARGKWTEGGRVTTRHHPMEGLNARELMWTPWGATRMCAQVEVFEGPVSATVVTFCGFQLTDSGQPGLRGIFQTTNVVLALR